MSKYTTGELAKLCGVSVRTVQYYDARNILNPSELSEGGRRLYTEEDLKRMQLICFFRELGLSINSIATLLADENPEKVVALLLEQQEAVLKAEVFERQEKLAVLEEIKRGLKDVEKFSVESIIDVAKAMKEKNQLKKLHATLLLTGLPVTALQVVSIILWITNGLWWLFVLWGVIAIPYGVWVSLYYFKRIAYICPECHEEFKPKFKEAFWTSHTPKMRRLTCPKCGKKGFCLEIYARKADANKNEPNN